MKFNEQELDETIQPIKQTDLIRAFWYQWLCLLREYLHLFNVGGSVR